MNTPKLLEQQWTGAGLNRLDCRNHFEFAMASDDHLLSREDCFDQPRKLAFVIEHVQGRWWMRAVVPSLTWLPWTYPSEAILIRPCLLPQPATGN